MFRKSLESPDKQRIKELLRKYADGRYRDSVIEFIPESGIYFIFVPNSVTPFSSKAATTLKNRLKRELGLEADVEKYSDFENSSANGALSLALEKLLESNFVDVAMLNSRSGSIDVVVYVKSEDEIQKSAVRRELVRKIGSFLQAYDLRAGNVYITELAQGPPTQPQVLWSVYKLAPASLEEISQALSRQGLAVPSAKWLKKVLDSLVRARAIIWDKSERYALTNLGTSVLPHRRGRNSPDVARALELGRRKW